MRQVKPDWQQKVAKERIQILFDLARKEFLKKPERTRRYVQLARKIGMRYNIRFPKKMKESFCKKCSMLLVPGKNLGTRLDGRTKSVIIKCMNCNYIYRKPYK